jgi:uncharacterized membrane protein YkoI
MALRSNLLWLLLAGSLVLTAAPAFASDDDHNSGSDRGSDDRGGDDHDDDHSGGDDDHSDGDDNGNDTGNSGTGNAGQAGVDGGVNFDSDDVGILRKRKRGSDSDQARALTAVKNENAASLREILGIVRERYEGPVVNVSLGSYGTNLIYGIKVLDKNNTLIEVKVDAKSRKVVIDGS